MPELMCVPCVLQVSRAFTFKQQCRRSEQTLKSFIGDLESIGGSKNSSTCHDGLEEIESTKVTPSICKRIVEEICLEQKFASSSETTGAHLDGELDLSTLPPGIESDSFEEEIELSSLPGDTQFSSVADEDIQGHLTDDILSDTEEETKFDKEDMPNKFDDYFDEIKIDVSHVVSLADNDLPDQSIEEETFGELLIEIRFHIA